MNQLPEAKQQKLTKLYELEETLIDFMWQIEAYRDIITKMTKQKAGLSRTGNFFNGIVNESTGALVGILSNISGRIQMMEQFQNYMFEGDIETLRAKVEKAKATAAEILGTTVEKLSIVPKKKGRSGLNEEKL